MSRLSDRLERELERLEQKGRRRRLCPAAEQTFVSNDYLGMSRHPLLRAAVAEALDRGVPLGATGSRLLSGESTEHRDAERAFARFIGREAALLFGSGFTANLALLSTLPGRHDLILVDSAVHASLKEGARSSPATKQAFAHNDLDELRQRLQKREAYRDVYVVVEGVYSMDGETAPLREIDRLVRSHEAHLIVDEAHATGLFGANLRGAVEESGIPSPLATVHPCGKGLGLAGGFIAADRTVIDYLINIARPFIFSTAPPPLLSVALERAITLLPTMQQTAGEVLRKGIRLRRELERLTSWSVIPGRSPIVPVIIGQDSEAVAVSRHLQTEGFDLRPIRPPTVPEGSARLRITLTAAHPDERIEELAAAMLRCEQTCTTRAENANTMRKQG